MPIKLDFKPIIKSFLRIWLFQIQEHAKAKPDRDQSETEGKERSKKEEDCGEENSQNGIRLGKVEMKTVRWYLMIFMCIWNSYSIAYFSMKGFQFSLNKFISISYF